MVTREARIRERVAGLRAFERTVEQQTVEQTRTPHAQSYCADLLRDTSDTAKRHGDALAGYLGIDDSVSDHPFAISLAHTSSATALLQAAYVTTSYAVAAYTMLTTMAFRLYEPRLRELGPKHMKAYMALAHETVQLLADVAAEEQAADGLECHCVCPMCGLGACGCVAITRQALDTAWREIIGRAPSGDGFPLQTPRKGSPLHAAGAHRGDRLLAVDGKEVRAIPDIQAALRKHAIGDVVQVAMRRGTQSPQHVDVAHVSDYPKT